MRNRTKFTTAIASVAAAIAILPVSGAFAAHGGALAEADLDGRSEVSSSATDNRIVGDPNGRGEAYVFSPGGSELCYVVEVDKLDGDVTGAHIHAGAEGENGPVVVALSPPVEGASAGCVDVGDAQLAADIVLRRPADFYVNVHTSEYPGGAVRGQLG